MKTPLLALVPVFVSALALQGIAETAEKSPAPTATTATTAPTVATTPADPAAKPAPAEVPIPKSSFSYPAKPDDGRDPFFPNSTRLFGVKKNDKPTSTVDSSGVVFNGLSGSEQKQLAMINGHTFAEGEAAMVNTTHGRLHLLLLGFKDQGRVAVVEVAGERRELRFLGR